MVTGWLSLADFDAPVLMRRFGWVGEAVQAKKPLSSMKNLLCYVLGRVPNSEQSIFNGLKMPKSGKTALNCLTIFQYYLHNLPCFAGDLVYF